MKEHSHRWNAETKDRVLEELRQPGAVASRVAKQNNIPMSTLYNWNKRSRKTAKPEDRVASEHLPTDRMPLEDESASASVQCVGTYVEIPVALSDSVKSVVRITPIRGQFGADISIRIFCGTEIPKT